MSYGEDFSIATKELDALREELPEIAEEAVPSKTSDQYYSLDLAKRIIDYSAQGKSLHWVAKQSQMPCYSTLLKWAKSHPEFSKLLKSVRDARALHFEEAAIEAAENACGKDADRLRFEAYKWGAEVNDPTTYGKKVTHSGDATNPIILQVVTGFGEPNEWQTPPKLNEDGTIQKKVIEVSSNGSSDPGDTEEANTERDERSSEEARQELTPSSSEPSQPSGVQSLQPE